jgi:hypothetical protein
MFIQDRLKEVNRNSNGNIFTIESRKELKESYITAGVQPFGAEKWLFFVDGKKVGLTYKDMRDMMQMNVTGLYVIEVDNYKEYKRIKGVFGEHPEFLDLYLSKLYRSDILYLYDYYVPKENGLTPKVYNQVVKNYGNDVDAVLTLFKALQSGVRVDTLKDVVAICGTAGNTVESYIMALLKSPPTTVRGTSTILRNRMKAGKELADTQGYDKTWMYMVSCIKALCEIKMLMISGVVYKHITKIPEGYNEKKLYKYQRYIWQLEEIPFSTLIRLRYHLQKKHWYTGVDFESFIYGYYYESIKSELENSKVS